MSAYLFLSFVVFLGNIPLGYFRENCQKFSLSWFFWIHASIPLIIYVRFKLGISSWFIPAAIVLAIIGQGLGAKLRRQEMTEEDNEKYQRIGDLKLPPGPGQVIADEKVTVVLMNMGGPKTNTDVKDFLYRVFLDPIILRFPFSKITQPFFGWLIVNLRAKATQQRYQLIGGGSPIFDSTQKQTEALKAELVRRGRNIEVIFSFNYSEPLPTTTIKKLKASNKEWILPLSLYPHYSAATTGSTLHYIQEEAGKSFPELKFLESGAYYLHDDYIRAFKDRIKEQLKPGESLDEFYLLFSAHGLPLYFLTEGDPYPFQISQTAARILKKLNRTDSWSISYQSAVGPLQWLKPLTDEVLKNLAARRIKKVIVVPISFVSDHIETICEIDMEYRHIAEQAGITDFRMSKALECHPGFITALADTVEAALPAKTAIKILEKQFV